MAEEIHRRIELIATVSAAMHCFLLWLRIMSAFDMAVYCVLRVICAVTVVAPEASTIGPLSTRR
ncbi:hypothetical protein [Halorubrum kocurii]|uniref:Uncharacterized protein n=1 Tax=Halorubrum kocurii JCM 14978 TaxID=1230456 RepID=M0P8W8_9EURY|nr:hypothetical protein [Halorubrum kocurii]EMA66298.1 hypothetical protein C468_04804 [Halorubrum kocurii JCM 14978]